MNNLYIWFQRTKLPKGHPLLNDILLKSNFDLKRPNIIHVGEDNWRNFNHYNMDFPPKDTFAFPSEMYLLINKKKYKEINFDYLDYHYYVKLVSENFISFLKENGLNKSYYEIASLNIIDLKGELMTKDKYYALRFGKFDDDLFNFNLESKKRAAGLRDTFIYPDMKIKTEITNKNIFVLFEFCYRDCLVLNEKGKNDVIKRYYSFEIYKAEDYPYIFNNQRNWELLPFDNSFKING
jgi:hypothetical protein